MDSLRAIAAVSILWSHVILIREAASPGPLAGLGAGVTVFFVITGFLLYRPFVTARMEMRASPPVIAYLRRRLLRIVPAYWVALTVVAIYPGLVPPTDQWWAYYSLLQHYVPEARTGGLPQTWSLSVEFTFYALLPLYALAAGALARSLGRRNALARELAPIFVLGIAGVAFWLHPVEALRTPLQYIAWFAVGMGLAVSSVVVARSHEPSALARFVARRPGLCWLAAGLVYCSFAFQPLDERHTLSVHSLQAVFAGLLLLPAVFHGDTYRATHRFLNHRLPAWLGLVSYGIFLWHIPVVTVLSTSSVFTRGPFQGVVVLGMATMALTIPLAALSYYLIERPMLRFKRSRPSAPRTAASPAQPNVKPELEAPGA